MVVSKTVSRLIELSVVLFGIVLGVAAILHSRYGLTLKRLADADPACPVRVTLQDYYREFARGSSLTRYGRINGKPAARPGDVVIDCGAHTGDTAREFLASGASLVVAIDPSDFAVSGLRRNLPAEIAAGRVIVKQVAVLDRDGWLTLYQNPHDHGQDSVVLPNVESGKRVPTTTVDAIVNELALDRVDLIKMDIEGAEQQALLGARETIRRFRPRLAIASYHLPDDFEKIPRIIADMQAGYRIETARCLVWEGRIFPNLLYFY